jgi:ubiquinone biosynthesis accessory factor UbiK
MINFEKLSDLSNKIKEISQDSPLADVNKNMNALIKSALTKMELISREEFDIQSQILHQTQAKLAELESKLATLEAQLIAASADNI